MTKFRHDRGRQRKYMFVANVTVNLYYCSNDHIYTFNRPVLKPDDHERLSRFSHQVFVRMPRLHLSTKKLELFSDSTY